MVIENAFLEMFKLLAENFDDVLESVLSSVEETLSKDDSTEKLKRIENEISSLEKKIHRHLKECWKIFCRWILNITLMTEVFLLQS